MGQQTVMFKAGTKLFRIIKIKKQWFFCVYEVIKCEKSKHAPEYYSKLEIAPILTYDNIPYKSHTTLMIPNFCDPNGFWCHEDWDFIGIDENVVKEKYLELTKNENQES